MRTALLIYGHMRTYQATVESLKKNIIDILNPDVFIHTWDEIEARTPSWHSEHMNVFPLSEDHINKIKVFYDHKNILIESQNVTERSCITTPNNNISLDGQKFMLESIKKANRLKTDYEEENDFKYDLVVKIRPDIMLFTNIPIPKSIESNRFYVGSNNRISACDIISFSESHVMDAVSTAIDFFDEFYVERARNETLSHTSYVDFVSSLGFEMDYIDFLYGKHWAIERGERS